MLLLLQMTAIVALSFAEWLPIFRDWNHMLFFVVLCEIYNIRQHLFLITIAFFPALIITVLVTYVHVMHLLLMLMLLLLIVVLHHHSFQIYISFDAMVVVEGHQGGLM